MKIIRESTLKRRNSRILIIKIIKIKKIIIKIIIIKKILKNKKKNY